MGPRAGLDRCGKSRPLRGFDPRTVQPEASRYTAITCCTWINCHLSELYYLNIIQHHLNMYSSIILPHKGKAIRV